MSTKPTIAVVYDTCFLMHPKFWRPGVQDFKVVEFVPNEVAQEISRHIKDKVASDVEKRLRASDARQRVAELIDAGAEEPSLDNLEEPTSDPLLRADSPTDRKLLDFVQHLAQSGNFAFVFLATNDGGIMYDLAHLRKNGLCVRWITPHNHNTWVPEPEDIAKAQALVDTKAEAEAQTLADTKAKAEMEAIVANWPTMSADSKIKAFRALTPEYRAKVRCPATNR